MDNKKVKAIVDIPEPRCKEDIQRLIGIVNYLSPYISDMCTLTAAIRELPKKDTEFIWHAAQQSAPITTIKDISTNKPVLQFYDSSKRLTTANTTHRR